MTYANQRDSRSGRPGLVWRWPAARRRRALPLAHPGVILVAIVVMVLIALLIAAGSAQA